MLIAVQISRLLLLFLVVISTGGIYYQFYSTQINLLSLVLALFLLWETRINKNEYSLKAVSSLGVVLLLILLNFLLHINDSLRISDFLSLSVRIVIVFILVYHYKVGNANFIKDLYFILIFLMVHGTINFFIINIFRDSLIGWQSEIIQFRTQTKWYLFFVSDYYLPLRNCGLFWEPGVFQLFINLFVFINLFILKSVKISVIAFGFVMVLSTQSTLGIILFGLLILNYYIRRINLRKMIVFAVLFIFSLFLFWPNIKEKFIGNYKVSYQARVFDTATGLLALIDRPVFGYGYYPRDNSKLTYKSDYYKKGIETAELKHIYRRGNTNSIVINFVYWGIPVGALILYLLYRQTVIESNKLLFFIFNVLACMGEPLLFSGLFLLYISSSLISKKVNPKYLLDENN